VVPSLDIFTQYLYAFFRLLMHAACPVHPILIDLITLTEFCEESKVWSSSLCDYVHIFCDW